MTLVPVFSIFGFRRSAIPVAAGLFLIFQSISVYAANVKVNLFAGQYFSSITLSHVSGKYVVKAGSVEVITISSGDTVSLQVSDDQILLFYKGNMVAFGDQFSVQGTGLDNAISVRAGEGAPRVYDDDLSFLMTSGGINCYNMVDLEKYVAGVVQAEAGGSSNNKVFFQVQSIVSRTYALRMLATYGDSVVFTDDVTNQVYKGRNEKPVIAEAVRETTGQVIVHNDSILINALFHSNSGGFTLSSADVWVTSLPYLQSVVDTFSLTGKNYSWSTSIPVVQWLNYLDSRYKYPVYIDSMRQLALNFCQAERQKYFYHDIPLTAIRNDLKLRSTFFSVTSDRDMVVFNGYGYGHGVGLSQEGAIRMAELGYSCEEIIRFYYSGVAVKSCNSLPVKR